MIVWVLNENVYEVIDIRVINVAIDMIYNLYKYVLNK